MFETKIKVGGMMCGMCEAHINDAVRAACPVKKVTSSHSKGETVILTETEPDTAAIKAATTTPITVYSFIAFSSLTVAFVYAEIYRLPHTYF